MGNQKILVLGAGLAGLSAAWHLQRRGKSCLVLEKESAVGGLCRSKKVGKFTFDFDGHLLHFRHKYTHALVQSLLKENLKEYKRSAWIYHAGTFSRYPFQAKLFGLPRHIVKECLLDFVQASLNGAKARKHCENFHDWIQETFGRGIAKHFMVPYNTKFWTVPPQELTCEWLPGFIPVPSLIQVVEGTVKDSLKQFGYNARFWYPRAGSIHMLPLALAHQVTHIEKNSEIREIDLAHQEVRLQSGRKEQYDVLISTIPLPEMLRLVPDLPETIRASLKKLRWTSIYNVNIGIEKRNGNERHWVYFPDHALSFFRVGFYHNFAPHLSPKNEGALYVEVAYSKEKPLTQEEAIARVKKDLLRVGLISRTNDITTIDINDITYGYPLYDRNYQASREECIKFLLKHHIIACGRYGSWRYFSMEDALLDGKRVASVL
jgi:protoporphyrinogen oxidase